MVSGVRISPTSWYRRRPYPHFDIPLSSAKASKYVSNPQKVARHSFYPFIRYVLSVPRGNKASTRIPPVETKERFISYPAHKDGYIFSYYKALLEEQYEPWLSDNNLVNAVTAFRKNRENNVTLAQKAFDFIRQTGPCEIIATDVEKFFDNINHQLLKQQWANFLGLPFLPTDHFAVFKAITKYSYIERHKLYNLFRIPIRRNLRRKRICSPEDFRMKVVPALHLNPLLNQKFLV